jgi:hypothetical protein
MESNADLGEELESPGAGSGQLGGGFLEGRFMAAQPNLKPEERRRPDPNEKLVKVFDSEEESEAMVVKGLLDSANIENDLASASLLQEAFPGLGGMIILVREEDAEKARSLIAEYRRPPASDEGGDEVDDDETVG